MIRQDYEDEKNPQGFFDCECRRASGSSPFTSLMRREAPKNVKKNVDLSGKKKLFPHVDIDLLEGDLDAFFDEPVIDPAVDCVLDLIGGAVHL